MFAKVLNDQIIQYPSNPNIDNPNVSFAVNWNGGTIAGNTYVIVESTNIPSANLGWKIIETTPAKENDVWKQTWTPSLLPTDKLKNTITNKRYDVEIGGVRVGDHIYSTDRESQTKYVAILVNISQSNTQTWSINWKTKEDKFIRLNSQDMLAVIEGVRNHIELCFDKEAEYYELIDTANTVVLESTNFSAGWPSNN